MANRAPSGHENNAESELNHSLWVLFPVLFALWVCLYGIIVLCGLLLLKASMIEQQLV